MQLRRDAGWECREGCGVKRGARCGVKCRARCGAKRGVGGGVEDDAVRGGGGVEDDAVRGGGGVGWEEAKMACEITSDAILPI